MKSRMNVIGFTIAAVAMFAAGPAAVGQLTCNLPGLICSSLPNGKMDTNCPKIPTSLAIANGGATLGVGWYNNGTQCGINLTTKKPCGSNLSTGCCNCESTGFQPPCDIDPDFPGCIPPIGPIGFDPPCGDDPCDDGGKLPIASIPLPTVATRLGSMVQQVLPPSAESTLNALLGLKSVHFVASVSVTMRDSTVAQASPARSTAEYEYWESGPSYRIRNTLDPKAGLVDIPELAFDGRYHQVLLGSAAANAALAVRRGDERTATTPLENPLFLALAYLSPEDADSCPGCELRLADLQYLARLRAGLAESSAAATSGQAPVVPGGRSYGEGHPSTSHRLALDTNGRIVSIRDVDAAGNLLRQIDLADFRTVAGLGVELPRTVTLSKSNVGEASPSVVARYEIGTLEVNKTIPASTFSLISLPRVHKIWNSDFNVFMKYEQVPGDAVCPKKTSSK
jgi:hypothetical protein